MEGYTRLLEGLGAPGAAVLVAFVGALLWIGRQLIVLRKNVESLRSDIGASQRNAIVDAWERLLQLRERGLSPEEAELLKSQLLATIPIGKGGSAPEPARQNATAGAEPAVKQADPTLSDSLVRFGFFGVWGVGWGAGMAFFLGGATLLLGTNVLQATTVLGAAGYSVATLAVALAYMGLGVVLPASALAASLRGLLDFMSLAARKLGGVRFADQLAGMSRALERASSRLGG